MKFALSWLVSFVLFLQLAVSGEALWKKIKRESKRVARQVRNAGRKVRRHLDGTKECQQFCSGKPNEQDCFRGCMAGRPSQEFMAPSYSFKL